MGREDIAILIRVELHEDRDLAEIVETGNAAGFSLARANAGSSIAARMAMIAMTTSNSIRVKARVHRGDFPAGIGFPKLDRIMTRACGR